MLKIRRPLGRLIFNMGIAIPGKTVFLIETAPRCYNHTKTNTSAYLIGCTRAWHIFLLAWLTKLHIVWKLFRKLKIIFCQNPLVWMTVYIVLGYRMIYQSLYTIPTWASILLFPSLYTPPTLSLLRYLYAGEESRAWFRENCPVLTRLGYWGSK